MDHDSALSTRTILIATGRSHRAHGFVARRGRTVTVLTVNPQVRPETDAWFRDYAVLPDFTLPDDTGTMRRSELQGDDAMILMLGRGEHCPRERQHQREMLMFHQWCTVAFTSR